MNRPNFRLTLTGMALGVLLALMLAPQTRWLVRLQTLTNLGLYHPVPGLTPNLPLYHSVSAANDARLRGTVAASHSEDFQLQYAAALGESSRDTLLRLRALTARFPDTPALYANILRYETEGNVHLSRSEDFMGQPPPPDFHPSVSSPAALAVFDREAAAGEQTDPQNAYFPMMRAVGLFSAHRDAAGLQAVHRAAQKTFWQDYATNEAEAQWRMNQIAFDDPGGLGRSGAFASILLPHYSGLRGAARIATYQAIATEQAGHAEEGLKIRRGLIRCSRLMREQSPLLIGSLVAVAMGRIAWEQPGHFSTPEQDASPITPEQRQQKRLALYCAYVRRLGHPEAAREAQADYAAGESIHKFEAPRAFDVVLRPLQGLMMWWLAGLSALSNLGGMLLLGGAAAILARTRWMRENQAVPASPIGWKAILRQSLFGFGAILLVMLLVALGGDNFGGDNLSWQERQRDWLLYCADILALLLLALAVRWLIVRRPPLPRLPRRKLGAALLTALCLYGIYDLAGRQTAGAQEIFQSYSYLTAAYEGDDNSSDFAPSPAQIILIRQICSATALLCPALLALTLSLVSYLRGIPVSLGLVQGLQKTVPGLACLLLILYGGLTLETLRQEKIVSTGLERSLHGEGQYVAELTGQAWPGPVR